MNNYQRLEVNLLPPEMAPGPAVRFTTIFNVIASCLAIGFVLLHMVTTISATNALKKHNKDLNDKIVQAEPDVKTYKALKEIQDNTEGRGKLVGMASSTYVEFPVILDRVSRLLPAGVQLMRATSGSTGRADKEMILEFRTSDNDPGLITSTLEAFKATPIFRDPYLRSGNFQTLPLEELRNQFGIPYTYDNPDPNAQFVTQTYDFEIRTGINSPLELDDMGTVMDKSEYMLPFELASDPSAKPAPGRAASGGAAEAAPSEAAPADAEGSAAAPAAAGGAK